MRDASKSKAQLIAELHSLRARVAALEGSLVAAGGDRGVDLPAAFYREIIETAHGVPYQLNIETGEYVYIGPGINDWLDVAAEQFTRRCYLDAIEEVDLADSLPFDGKESYHAAFARGEVARYHAHVRVRTPHDGPKWLSDCAVPIRDESGRVVGSLGILQDITDRKKSEQVIRESERQLRLALTHMPVMVMALDDRDTIIVWNQECERVTGYGADEVVGDPGALERLYPDPRYRADLLAEWQSRAGDYRDWECTLTRKDGSTRVVAWSAQSSRCRIPGWHRWAVGVDVTQRLNAEAATRAKDQLLQAIIEGTDDAVFVKDGEGRYLLVNSADALGTGRSVAEVIGLTDRDLFPPALTGAIEESDRQVIDSKQKKVYEQDFDVPGRGRRTYSIAKHPYFGADGTVAGVVGIGRDITARKRAEEELRRQKEFAEGLIDTAQAVVLVLDSQGRVLSFNRYMERLCGYRLDEVQGRDWFDVFLPEWDRDAIRSLFSKSIRGRSVSGNVNPIVTKDGRLVDVEWHDTVITDGDGRITGLLAIGQDITDRLRAEQELRKGHEELEQRVAERTAALAASESRWRSLLDTIPHGIAECDADGTITFAGPSLDQMMGRPSGGLAGWKIWDLFDPAEASGLPEQHWRAVLRDHPTPTPCVTRGRAPCWTELVFQVDWDYRRAENGQVVGLVAVITDITARTHAQQQLLRSQKLIQKTSDTMPTLLFIYEYEGGALKFMNKRCTEFFALSPDHVASMREDYILRHVHSDDQQQVSAVRARIGALADGEQLEWELRLRNHYGEWRWLRFWYTVFSRTEDGAADQVLATAIDVTERKEAVQALIASEREKSLILRSVSEHVYYQDANFRVLWANRAAAEALDRSPDELIGRYCYELWQHCVEPCVDCPVAQARESGREVVTDKEGPDGRVWHIRAYPVFDETHQLCGTVVVSAEITEARRNEAERANLQEQLHGAQKMEAVGLLASGTAHDFNNLLTVILASTRQLRLVTAGQDDAQSALAAIEEAAHQAEEVTRSLLLFCHRMPGEKEPVDVGAVVQGSVRLIQRLLPASIDVSARVSSEFTPCVHADKTQLQQIILNLAINARDAMPDGGQLVLSVSEATGAEMRERGVACGESDVYMRLDVEDTGTGMSPDVQARVFEPFFTTKERGQGTGLGLAVVHGIVEEHRGCVFVRSVVGVGSTFSVFLPCVACAAREEVEPAETAMAPGDGETVLLAEDHRHVREIIAATLDSLGYGVVQVDDGPSLLERFAQCGDRIGLMLVDVDLPTCSGLDCVRQLRADGVDVPTILMTGRADVGSDVAPDDRTILLRKPFQMSDLAALLRHVLAGPAAGHAVEHAT